MYNLIHHVLLAEVLVVIPAAVSHVQVQVVFSRRHRRLVVTLSHNYISGTLFGLSRLSVIAMLWVVSRLIRRSLRLRCSKLYTSWCKLTDEVSC